MGYGSDHCPKLRTQLSSSDSECFQFKFDLEFAHILVRGRCKSDPFLYVEVLSMATDTTYVTMEQHEKEYLEQYITEEWGNNRITQGAAIAHLARKEVSADE